MKVKITVEGHLDTRWSAWLADLAIDHNSDGSTTLRGTLPDQTALYSVIDRMRDMNLALIAVQRLEDRGGSKDPT